MIRSLDKSIFSKNNGSKPVFSKNDGSRPAFERNNDNDEDRFGSDDIEYVKKSGKLKAYFQKKKPQDIWYKTHNVRLLALFRPSRLEAL